MKNLLLLLIGVFFLFFQSCNSRKELQIENVTEVKQQVQNIKKENEGHLEVASLPVKFDSIPILMHPLGNYEIRQRKIGYISKSSDNSYVNISSSYGDVLTGKMTNILFEKLNLHHSKKLTTNSLTITKVEFLRALFNSTKKQILLYTVLDNDSNEDGTINGLDESALYISKSDGSNFVKLTNSKESLRDYKFIDINKYFYFKTFENRNEVVKFRYYKIDFSKENVNVVEYFPTK